MVNLNNNYLEFDPIKKDKAMCSEVILHAADVSNPFKPFEIYN